MGLFSRKGERPPRIRKDAGELTIADFQTHDVWEFCLDEEGEEGQTECTVRPHEPTGTLRPIFDGGVRAEVQFSSGRTMPGAVWLTLLENQSPEPSVELWTDREAAKVIPDPLEEWDSVIYKSCRRFGFELPVAGTPGSEDTMERIRLVYKVLDTSPAEMWPLTVRPAREIEGLPRSWMINGWHRYGDPEGVFLK